jgi:hypothetical protein
MINRVGQAAEYQTYRILALPDLSRPAACSEVDCGSWRYGWETTVDERTDLGSPRRSTSGSAVAGPTAKPRPPWG